MQSVVINISAIIDRLKVLLGLDKDADIARLLGEPPKKLGVWKLRNTIPIEVLTSFCRQKRIRLEWALTGEGEPYQEHQTLTREASLEYQPTRQEDSNIRKIVDIMLTLDDKARAEILKQAKEKQELMELRKQKERELGFTEKPKSLGAGAKPKREKPVDA